MIDRLIIHIGSHKTGTTAIQKTLFDNREGLEKMGISYPDIGFVYYGHHGIAEAIEGKPRWPLDTVLSGLGALEGTVVISSENFSRSSQKGIDTLAAALEARSVEIVYYQRNVLDVLGVWWRELVKHGNRQTFPVYYAECLAQPFQVHMLHPIGILEKWGTAFGRTNIRAFLYDAVEETAGHFMKEVVGYEDYRSSPETRAINKSFSVADTELMRRLNCIGLKGVDFMLANAHALDFSRERMSSYVRNFSINFDCFLFKHVEDELVRLWGDRFGASGAHLFEKRRSALPYVDPDFWLEEPDAAEEMRSIGQNIREMNAELNPHMREWVDISSAFGSCYEVQVDMGSNQYRHRPLPIRGRAGEEWREGKPPD